MLVETKSASVKNENAALFESLKQFILIHIGLFVASNIIRLIYKVGRFDWLLAESKMRYRNASRLLRNKYAK